SHEKLRPHLDDFLRIYRRMVESGQYGWSFAETIASHMRLIFRSEEVAAKTRARALELAVDAAYRQNRFAAMDTCVSMITSVDNDEVGVHVVGVIQKNPHSFVTGIEPAQCKSESVRSALRALRAEKA